MALLIQVIITALPEHRTEEAGSCTDDVYVQVCVAF